jgi:hypothetical protein
VITAVIVGARRKTENALVAVGVVSDASEPLTVAVT